MQGREKTNVDVIEWIKKGISLGVGEILVTSIDQDGTLKGYDLELIKEVSENVNIPFVACGGGGSLDDINDVLKISENINIALGTALHKNILKIDEIKSFFKKKVIQPGYIVEVSKVYIIAEAGVNHNGDLKKAKALVKIAKKVGADAVKFQYYKTENLVLKETPKTSYQKKTRKNLKINLIC